MESVLELVGIDRITLAPAIIEKLASTQKNLDVKLTEDYAKSCDIKKLNFDEKVFRWEMNGTNKTLIFYFRE